MRSGLSLILALMAGALLLLFYNHESGRTLGMSNDQFANLAYLAILGSVIAAGLVGSHRHMSDMVRNLLLWVVLILGLAAGWIYRDDLQQFATTVTAGLVPGRPIVLVQGENPAISLRKSLSGHFEAEALVNGEPVHFLIDTGATTIALSYEDALAAGISPDQLRFSLPISTANGPAMAAPVRLEWVEIGPIARSDLRATVAEPGKLNQSLLGMNFISSLSGFEMRRNEIILKD